MAVEFDIVCTEPTRTGELIRDATTVLAEMLCLRKMPVVTVQRQDGAEWAATSILDPTKGFSLRMSIGKNAIIDVSTYPDAGTSKGSIACVSYAPLRTPESKTLCVAVAVALAKLNRTAISDEANILRLGGKLEPKLVEDSFRLTFPGESFESQSERLWKENAKRSPIQ